MVNFQEHADADAARAHAQQISKAAKTIQLGDELIAEAKRHPSSARLHELLRELGELHDRKQKDYGTNTDPFANVRSSEEFGVPAWVGALVRLNDKIVRLKQFAKRGDLANESAEDSMKDIAVYAMIALVLYEEAK